MNMDTVTVLKFGGSSVADNIRLNMVAEKIISIKEEEKNIVVVVSAQGKTTDQLIKEAKELSAVPDDREMDVLLSTGEQISMSKLAILLKRMGYDAISLTGWQAGMYTNKTNQNAKIETIDTTRIEEELKKGKIVIVAGFQGINEKGDITTLGRGGSDTTAVAIAAALKAKHCYIFSDVDGVYTTDPKKIPDAQKLPTLSYTEMLEIANEGARVLHNRCIEVGEKYHIPIITKSTFNDKPGSVVQDKIEDTSVKSIVKNDDIILVDIYEEENPQKWLSFLWKLGIDANHFMIKENHLYFTIKNSVLNKFQEVLEKELQEKEVKYHSISRIAIVGHGIKNDTTVMEKVLKIVDKNHLEIFTLEESESKIVIMFTKQVEPSILEQLHEDLCAQNKFI